MKTGNRIISTLIILANVYFLPVTIDILIERGGPMGYGLLVLPISISINLLLVTAGLSFKTKLSKSKAILVSNGLGFLWALYWILLFNDRI